MLDNFTFKVFGVTVSFGVTEQGSTSKASIPARGTPQRTMVGITMGDQLCLGISCDTFAADDTTDDDMTLDDIDEDDDNPQVSARAQSVASTKRKTRIGNYGLAFGPGVCVGIGQIGVDDNPARPRNYGLSLGDDFCIGISEWEAHPLPPVVPIERGISTDDIVFDATHYGEA